MKLHEDAHKVQATDRTYLPESTDEIEFGSKCVMMVAFESTIFALFVASTKVDEPSAGLMLVSLLIRINSSCTLLKKS